MSKAKKSIASVLLLALALVATAAPAQTRLTGIPVDSEYVIFIIDNSGSMRRYAWDRVMVTVQETLEVFPAARGFQVLNDAGQHLLLSYRYEWIPDTPANRQWILDELEDFDGFSTSNPQRGILEAFDRYYDPAKSIALFLIGDDFSAGSSAIDALLSEVETRNRVDGNGRQVVRIHSLAMPVYWEQLGADGFANTTGAAHATLMSALSRQNSGGFVGLAARRYLAAPAAAGAAAAVEAGPEDAAGQDPGGERRLIVVDASANMGAADWQRALAAAEWLLGEAGDGASFQLLALTDAARSVVASTDGQWLDNASAPREQALARLRAMTPTGTADLTAVAAAVEGLEPSPDRVYLLAASDPAIASRGDAAALFDSAAAPMVYVLLYGADGIPQTVPYYWSMALASGGSLVVPAEDWP